MEGLPWLPRSRRSNALLCVTPTSNQYSIGSPATAAVRFGTLSENICF